MYSGSSTTCDDQCRDAGRREGKLVIDGDVCPFKYFCKCTCHNCAEECARKGKVHAHRSVDIFGCSICSCQCEKTNCYRVCNGVNFQVQNSTFGCPQCQCLCPDINCDIKCNGNGLGITKYNASGCLVCDRCNSQGLNGKRDRVAQTVIQPFFLL